MAYRVTRMLRGPRGPFDKGDFYPPNVPAEELNQLVEAGALERVRESPGPETAEASEPERVERAVEPKARPRKGRKRKVSGEK